MNLRHHLSYPEIPDSKLREGSIICLSRAPGELHEDMRSSACPLERGPTCLAFCADGPAVLSALCLLTKHPFAQNCPDFAS